MSDTTTLPNTNERTEMIAGPTSAPVDKACCRPERTDLPPEPRLGMSAPDVAGGAVFAALLGDRNRAAIMRMLADGPMCVCEMATALGEKQNNVSMHLARLRDAGLVRTIRHPADARWTFYERDPERCAEAAALIGELLR
jgi:ArsR family transcriptional regulator